MVWCGTSEDLKCLPIHSVAEPFKDSHLWYDHGSLPRTRGATMHGTAIRNHSGKCVPHAAGCCTGGCGLLAWSAGPGYLGTHGASRTVPWHGIPGNARPNLLQPLQAAVDAMSEFATVAALNAEAAHQPPVSCRSRWGQTDPTQQACLLHSLLQCVPENMMCAFWIDHAPCRSISSVRPHASRKSCGCQHCRAVMAAKPNQQ